MRYPRVLLITAVALILSGCLTIGPPYEEHIASSGAPAPGKGRVYVYRPSLLPLFGLAGIEPTSEAFRWDAANGMQTLGNLPGGESSVAVARQQDSDSRPS
jgi:hypothetical protein